MPALDRSADRRVPVPCLAAPVANYRGPLPARCSDGRRTCTSGSRSPKQTRASTGIGTPPARVLGVPAPWRRLAATLWFWPPPSTTVLTMRYGPRAAGQVGARTTKASRPRDASVPVACCTATAPATRAVRRRCGSGRRRPACRCSAGQPATPARAGRRRSDAAGAAGSRRHRPEPCSRSGGRPQAERAARS